MRRWLPVILWMAVIFVVSTDLGAAAHTSRFIMPLLHWLDPAADAALLDRVHFIIRKCGHLTEYAILALLVFRAWQKEEFGRALPWRAVLFTWLICAAYAGTDEFHQSFVPSRTASIGDVMIDSSGAACALFVLVFWRLWKRPRCLA